jgi:hypothetical protein
MFLSGELSFDTLLIVPLRAYGTNAAPQNFSNVAARLISTDRHNWQRW